jgi:BASS family bile acid:Na+ symporter
LFIVLTSTAVTLWFRRLSTHEALARDQAKIGTMATA